MENDKEKIMVDLTLTTGSVAIVDNDSDQTPVPFRGIYRTTTEAHKKESFDKLNTLKVNQVLPNLFDPKEGLIEGITYKAEVATPNGNSEFTFSIKQEGNIFSLTGVSENQSISVPLPRKLLKPNKCFNEKADLMRAVYMLMFRCCGISFQPGTTEERGFKKLRKSLWP